MKAKGLMTAIRMFPRLLLTPVELSYTPWARVFDVGTTRTNLVRSFDTV
jgi:hypothetical protein